ncbi:MAG: hypothetical protein HY289_08780 [Planctomycetes bacterium]|nr:hypothetical protein [Planctomycetota bacterium]
MPEHSESFRNSGILPEQARPALGPVRCYFPFGHVFGQFAGTAIMLLIGLGGFVLFAFALPFPTNVVAAALILALFGYIVYRATKDDYAWVELDGNTIRAQHLYTRQIIVRNIEEIEELVTVVYPLRTLAIIVVEAWLGRVKAITIKFRDHHSPIPFCRADPAMTNGQEFIEAVIFRMSLLAYLDADVVNLEGTPLVKRIFWQEKS